MCSKPVVRATVRAASAVMSFGSSEVLRSKAPNLSPYAAAEKVASAGAGVLGLPEGPDINFPKPFSQNGVAEPPPPLPPPSDVAMEDIVRPGGPAPGTTTVDSIQARRRKRLAALQGGFQSTIATGPGGVAGSPSLLSPSAGGLKLKLGA